MYTPRINVTSFLSLNVRGLRDFRKRSKIVYWLKQFKLNHIVFLQETHSSQEIENSWFKDWPGKCFFSHGTSSARGVCILIKDSLNYVVHNSVTDTNGRYVILDISVGDYRMSIANIYVIFYFLLSVTLIGW